MQLLQNPWVVGIGGGILSGAVVTILSRALLSRRENREYVQKVNAANQALVYAVRPMVADGEVPAREVLKALTESVARRHKVDASDLFTSDEVAQELVQEVMDSSFLNTGQKTKYCTQLSPLLVNQGSTPGQVSSPASVSTSQSVLADYRRRATLMTSAAAGAITAAMTIVISLTERTVGPGVRFALPAVMALTLVVVGTVVYATYRRATSAADGRSPMVPVRAASFPSRNKAPSPESKVSWLQGTVASLGPKFGFIEGPQHESFWFNQDYLFSKECAPVTGQEVWFVPLCPLEGSRNRRASAVLPMGSKIVGTFERILPTGCGFAECWSDHGEAFSIFVNLGGSEDWRAKDDVEFVVGKNNKGVAGFEAQRPPKSPSANVEPAVSEAPAPPASVT